MKKIHTKTVIDIETGEVLEDHFFEYEGPIIFSCGGDSLAPAKQQEAQSQINLNNALQQGYTQRNNAQTPFLMDRMKNGLPYFNDLIDFGGGTLARAAAPERASLLRGLSGFGDTLPSGFKEGVIGDFNANLARQFDDSMVGWLNQNEAAKENAANMLNPLGYAGAATGAAGSVLSAPPVQSGGFGNFMGGLVNGAVQGFSKGAGSAASFSI
jgi:hypothetical protein